MMPGKPPAGTKGIGGSGADLETLLRDAQDRLRGRAETSFERTRTRWGMRLRDIWDRLGDFTDFMTDVMGRLAALVAAAMLIGGIGYATYLAWRMLGNA